MKLCTFLSSPKRLDVATSNFADALVSSKVGICNGVPSTAALANINFVLQGQANYKSNKWISCHKM